MFIYILFTFVFLLVVILPFFSGAGGALVSSSTVNSPSSLKALKQEIIRRYLVEERAHKKGDLGAMTWKRRQVFLRSKYIDASRRLDFLEGLQKMQSEGEGQND